MSLARLAAPFMTISLIAGAPATAAPAPVAAISPLAQIPGLTVKYYDVAGRTIKDITASLQAQAPKDSTGQPVPTSVKWLIETNIKQEKTGTVCRVSSAKATMTSEVVLPRLASVKGVKARDLAQWQAYTASIEAQQAARLAAVRARLPEVERAILASSCAGATEARNKAVAEIGKPPAAAPAPAPVPVKPAG